MTPKKPSEPRVFDPFDLQEGQYHLAIAGRTRLGKSVFMSEYATRLLGSGTPKAISEHEEIQHTDSEESDL